PRVEFEFIGSYRGDGTPKLKLRFEGDGGDDREVLFIHTACIKLRTDVADVHTAGFNGALLVKVIVHISVDDDVVVDEQQMTLRVPVPIVHLDGDFPVPVVELELVR